MDAQVKREIASLASSITNLQNRVRALEEYDADDAGADRIYGTDGADYAENLRC